MPYSVIERITSFTKLKSKAIRGLTNIYSRCNLHVYVYILFRELRQLA